MTTKSSSTELNQALEEITDVEALEQAAEAEAANATAAPNAAEADQFRERARQQRERGAKALAKRFAGVASSLETVVINERVVGSSFERFFATIENGVFVIDRRGPMIMGKAHTESVIKQIDERIAESLKNATAELAGIKLQLSMHGENPGWLVPDYVEPASSHKVQIRSRRGIDVLKIFRMKDEIVTGMQQLSWNGELESSEIERTELDLKKELREIHNFVVRTLRGMRTKAASTVAKAEPVQEAA